MTAEELLLSNIDQAEVYAGQSDEKCVIDPQTRMISIPERYQLLGVESDESVERIKFQCPRVVGDNIDLSTLQLRVNYRNANSQTDQYIIDDIEISGENIIFSWLLSRKVTAYRGTVQFIICAVKASGSTITNEWNTTLAESQVLQGLEVDTPSPTEDQSDVISQLISMMQETQAASNQALEAAQDLINQSMAQIMPHVISHTIVFTPVDE